MEGVTTHTKRATIANGASTNILFTNAQGSSIPCNYFEVACSAAGAYLVVPSGITSITAAAFANSASGTYGFGVANAGGVYPVSLGHNRYTRAITITNLSGASRDVYVTYGIRTALPEVPRGFNPGI